MVITFTSAQSLRAKLGLPLANQVAGWIILGLSLSSSLHSASLLNISPVTASAIPFFLRSQPLSPDVRILTLFLGFAVIFVILSISVEAHFYTLYSATLFTWTSVETALKEHRRMQPKNDKNRLVKGYKATADDARIAVFFLFFVQVAFFGTGK